MAKKKELDKETQKVQTKGDNVRGLTSHEGWPIVRSMLHKKVGELLSLTSDVLTQSDPNTIIQIIAAKKRAADILVQWLNDVEGIAKQAEGNAPLLESIVYDFIINGDADNS